MFGGKFGSRWERSWGRKKSEKDLKNREKKKSRKVKFCCEHQGGERLAKKYRFGGKSTPTAGVCRKLSASG